MDISAEAIKEFEAIWIRHNPGKTPDKELLLRAAERLLRAVEHIYLEKENEN